jgi:hypothetical protein
MKITNPYMKRLIQNMKIIDVLMANPNEWNEGMHIVV